jgi:hypothetical protein
MNRGHTLQQRPNYFIIDGLPRTGSTTLVRLLNCHPDIACLMEPFHPRRYDGQFYRMSVQSGSVKSALALIRYRWDGFKHVWSPDSGWPFSEKPGLNEETVLSGGRVVFVQRRNFLKRHVSNAISKSINFWVGTRQQFCTRLENAPIPELDPAAVRRAVQLEREAIEHRIALFQRKGVDYISLFYEDFYGTQIGREQQFIVFNELLRFLGFRTITASLFSAGCAEYLDEAKYQWCSDDVYRLIPGITRIEHEVGSVQNGWLFS